MTKWPRGEWSRTLHHLTLPTQVRNPLKKPVSSLTTFQPVETDQLRSSVWPQITGQNMTKHQTDWNSTLEVCDVYGNYFTWCRTYWQSPQQNQLKLRASKTLLWWFLQNRVPQNDLLLAPFTLLSFSHCTEAYLGTTSSKHTVPEVYSCHLPRNEPPSSQTELSNPASAHKRALRSSPGWASQGVRSSHESLGMFWGHELTGEWLWAKTSFNINNHWIVAGRTQIKLDTGKSLRATLKYMPKNSAPISANRLCRPHMAKSSWCSMMLFSYSRLPACSKK